MVFTVSCVTTKNQRRPNCNCFNARLNINHPDLKEEIQTITYDDLFKDRASQVKATKVGSTKISVRKLILGLKNKKSEHSQSLLRKKQEHLQHP